MIGRTLSGSIGDLVIACAIQLIAPDVDQVKPVTDLVRCGSTEIERIGSRPSGAEGGVENDYSIGSCGAARELRIPEQSSAQVAHPEIEILVGRPCVCSTLGCGFHDIIGGEGGDGGRCSGNPGCRLSARIDRGERKLNIGIGYEALPNRRNFGFVGIRGRVVLIESNKLALDLIVADVLCRSVVDNMDYHWNGDWTRCSLLSVHREAVRMAFDRHTVCQVFIIS